MVEGSIQFRAVGGHQHSAYPYVEIFAEFKLADGIEHPQIPVVTAVFTLGIEFDLEVLVQLPV